MRVLQIVPAISLLYGGPSQMVLGLSQALAAQGVEITLLTTDANGDAGQGPLDVPLGCAVKQDGYQVYYFRCSPFRRYKFSLGLLRWLAQYASEYDLAHLHALFSPVITAAAKVAQAQQLPYILRPLGTLDPADLQKKQQLKRLYGTLLERANLAHAAAVHFTSAQEAKISQRYGVATNDLVIPLGVKEPPEMPELSTARLYWGIDQNKPLLLYMSRIDPKKGLDLLLPALEALVAQGQDFQFVLAGGNPQDPDYVRQIRSKIEASVLAKYTTITGFVQGEMKWALLQDADVFVLPSYYENFGIAVAEALVTGTPVVISDQVHIWREVENAQAGWVVGTQVDSLRQGLSLALQEGSQRAEKGKNARKLAISNYSWDAIAQQMIAAYEQILVNRK